MGKSTEEFYSFLKKIIIILQIFTIIILLNVNRVQAIPEKEDKYFLMTATGYYPFYDCGNNDGLTYTEEEAGYGCLAIDPDNGPLKLGQKVWVEGYGEGICNDIGGAIKEWKIDLCFNTLKEAQEYGVQLVKVFVID